MRSGVYETRALGFLMNSLILGHLNERVVVVCFDSAICVQSLGFVRFCGGFFDDQK